MLSYKYNQKMVACFLDTLAKNLKELKKRFLAFTEVNTNFFVQNTMLYLCEKKLQNFV